MEYMNNLNNKLVDDLLKASKPVNPTNVSEKEENLRKSKAYSASASDNPDFRFVRKMVAKRVARAQSVVSKPAMKTSEGGEVKKAVAIRSVPVASNFYEARCTRLMSNWLYQYIQRHQALPFVVDGINLTVSPGVRIDTQNSSVLARTYEADTDVLVASLFATQSGDGEIDLWTEICDNPENTYILEDPEITSPQNCYKREGYDEWRLYQNYDDNFAFFRARRNSLDSRWEPLANHNVISDFLMIWAFSSGMFYINDVSDLNRTYQNLITKIYAKIATDIFVTLNTHNRTASTYLPITVGNMYKLLVRYLGAFQNNKYAAIPIAQGVGADARVIIGENPTLKFDEITLYASVSLTEKKDAYRVSRNTCYRWSFDWEEIITINGVRYGVKSADATASGACIQYLFELDANDTTSGIVQNRLKWVNEPGYPVEYVKNQNDEIYAIKKNFKADQAGITIQCSGYVVQKHKLLDTSADDPTLTIEMGYVGDATSTLTTELIKQGPLPSNDGGSAFVWTSSKIMEMYNWSINHHGLPEHLNLYSGIRELGISKAIGIIDNAAFLTVDESGPGGAGQFPKFYVYTGSDALDGWLHCTFISKAYVGQDLGGCPWGVIPLKTLPLHYSHINKLWFEFVIRVKDDSAGAQLDLVNPRHQAITDFLNNNIKLIAVEQSASIPRAHYDCFDGFDAGVHAGLTYTKTFRREYQNAYDYQDIMRIEITARDVSLHDAYELGLYIKAPSTPIECGTGGIYIGDEYHSWPLYLYNITCQLKSMRGEYELSPYTNVLSEETLLNDASVSWSPQATCFIGSLAKPWSVKQGIIDLSTSGNFKDYLKKVYQTGFSDIVNKNELKKAFAVHIDLPKLAELLRFIQDANSGGLPVEAEIARRLLIDAKEVRMIRTAGVMTSIDEVIDSEEPEAVESAFSKISRLISFNMDQAIAASAVMGEEVSSSLSAYAADVLSGVSSVSDYVVTEAGKSKLKVGEYLASITELGEHVSTVSDLKLQDTLNDDSKSLLDVVAYRDSILGYLRQLEVDGEPADDKMLQALTECNAIIDEFADANVIKFAHLHEAMTDYVATLSDSYTFDRDAARSAFSAQINSLWVEVDRDYAHDNPEFHVVDGKVAFSEIWSKVKANSLGLDYTFKTEAIADMVDSGADMIDVLTEYQTLTAELCALQLDGMEPDQELSDRIADLSVLLKATKVQLADEYATLAADVLNFKFEDSLDGLADEQGALEQENANSIIQTQIDSIKNSVLTLSSQSTSMLTDFKGRAMVLCQDAQKLENMIMEKFSCLATATTEKAKKYYAYLVDLAKQTKEGLQEISNVLSFSLTSLIENVKEKSSDIQGYLQEMVGTNVTTASSYGWQNTAMFTPASNISLAVGTVTKGVCGAISTALSFVGRIISGTANKIRGAVMATVKDGVSFRQRAGGLPTLSLQAVTDIDSDAYFEESYPWLYKKIRDGQLLGNNMQYMYSQVGPLILVYQDYTWIDGDNVFPGIMTTINPVIIKRDDTNDFANDWFFAEAMAESVIYARKFANALMKKCYDLGLVDTWCEYDIPRKEDLLRDILDKATGTSSAETWMWRLLILGAGIALGALLCCTGYGTAAGLALIAGMVVLGECLVGPAADQSKIEHLENDNAYANATILSSDLASIWSGCLPSTVTRFMNLFMNAMCNLTTESGGQQVWVDVVHDGRGDAIDINDILGTAAEDHPDEIGFIPFITAAGYPRFQYRLVSDAERLVISVVGLTAIAVPVVALTKKAVCATLEKWNQKRIAKKNAEAWALEQPNADDYSTYAKDADGNIKRDEAGVPVKQVDKAALAKAQKDYKKKQAKIDYKASKWGNVSFGNTESEDGGFNLPFFDSEKTEVDSPENVLETVDYLVKRIG